MTYFANISLAALLCPISSKSSVASLPVSSTVPSQTFRIMVIAAQQQYVSWQNSTAQRVSQLFSKLVSGKNIFMLLQDHLKKCMPVQEKQGTCVGHDNVETSWVFVEKVCNIIYFAVDRNPAVILCCVHLKILHSVQLSGLHSAVLCHHRCWTRIQRGLH